MEFVFDKDLRDRLNAAATKVEEKVEKVEEKKPVEKKPVEKKRTNRWSGFTVEF